MRGTAQFLDQLPGAVGVPTGGVQQGFAEGVTISLLANAGPLLPAHVFVFLLEVRAKPQEPHSSRGAVVVVQPLQKHSTTPTVRSSVRKLWILSWCTYTYSFANPLCGLQEFWKGTSLSVSSSSSSSSTSSALSSDQSNPRGQVVGEAVRPPHQVKCITWH